MLLGIFALAIGAIVRNTAGGIAAFAAIFFVIPPLLNVLPSSWNNAIAPYLPDAAGRSIFSLTHDAHEPRSWPPASRSSAATARSRSRSPQSCSCAATRRTASLVASGRPLP